MLYGLDIHVEDSSLIEVQYFEQKNINKMPKHKESSNYTVSSSYVIGEICVAVHQ